MPNRCAQHGVPGSVLTCDGLQVSDDKVDAILQAPRPKDQSELQSFLGLVQYCSTFIPSFAIIARNGPKHMLNGNGA